MAESGNGPLRPEHRIRFHNSVLTVSVRARQRTDDAKTPLLHCARNGAEAKPPSFCEDAFSGPTRQVPMPGWHVGVGAIPYGSRHHTATGALMAGCGS